MLTDVGFLLAGAALLYLGGDWLVDGARGLAARFGVSPLFVGIVIMGFGTSAPEIVVTVDAALTGTHDVAIGNVVGSNIANLCLILAITALLSPVMANPTIIRLDG
ncbi:MAG: sodium:calcium antiporter, partial [Pseudomonadota bacterium]